MRKNILKYIANKKFLALLVAFVFVLLAGCGVISTNDAQGDNHSQGEISSQVTNQTQQPDGAQQPDSTTQQLDEKAVYTDKEQVALYIYTYGHLPSNYITKKQAEDAGWKSKGSLDEVFPGKSIGGDRFGNYEGALPKQKGRQYYECDIDYKKGNRNSKRIVYSNDGLIYYTEDHYKTFELLYGE